MIAAAIVAAFALGVFVGYKLLPGGLTPRRCGLGLHRYDPMDGGARRACRYCGRVTRAGA